MDGAATWRQELLCCPKISCFAWELLSSGTSGNGCGLEDSAEAEASSRAPL